MHAHIDLYLAHGLDRQRSSAQLASQLRNQYKGTDSRETVARARLEVARAVIGERAVREKYDRWLADPAAPPITETVLAELADEAKKRSSRRDWGIVGIGAALGTILGW